MNEEQIRNAIRLGVPFFAITPQGDVLARYLPFAIVFQWKKNQMIPAPLQGDDLIWWLQAAGEEGHGISGETPPEK